MKTIINILIAAAFLNGAMRVGKVAASYYQLKDASQQLLTFGAQVPLDDLRNHILEQATTLDVPLTEDDVEVTRDGLQTKATASYSQDVEVFPNFAFPFNFRFSVQAQSLSGLTSYTPPAHR